MSAFSYYKLDLYFFFFLTPHYSYTLRRSTEEFYVYYVRQNHVIYVRYSGAHLDIWWCYYMSRLYE